MTQQERTVIAAASTRPLIWRDHDDSRFVRLAAHPCPLLDDEGLCSVYTVRPMNCRRYMCGRTGDEPWTTEDAVRAIPLRVLADRSLRRQYAVNQRKAERWGLAHGWQW